jgi:hypothetical protein
MAGPAAAHIDRSRPRRVRTVMSRLCTPLAIALLAAVPACGKGKKGDTTPPASSGQDPSHMQDLEPGDVPPGSDPLAERPGADPGDPGIAPGADPDGDPEAEPGEAPPPPLVPPDLDIGSAEQKKQLAEHVSRARAALSGPNRDPDVAIEQARAALKVDATNIDAVVLLAHAYHAKRLHDTAEVVLDMMRAERGDRAAQHAGVFYVYGLVYDATERPRLAMESYERAVALDPNYRSALMNLGVHYLRNEQDAKAVTVYERLTGQLGVDTAPAWNNLGAAYRRRSGEFSGDRARRDQMLRAAENAFRRALQIDKNYAPTYYNVGLLYFDSDQFPGADGRPMPLLDRLKRARTYFDEYRRLPGANLELVDERTRVLARLITREERRQQAASQE